ncbi:MAG TPA: deoxyribonuclease IV [Melioribacteraceae bacterium]|nr:deoxyribonuclease IV [Melioribacteraceae bacterium]
MLHKIGAHTSIEGGIYNAVKKAKSLGFKALQIFTKNNNRWEGKELTDEDVIKYKAELKNSGIKFVVAHDSYLINLCAENIELLNKSRAAFIDELTRCERLEIPYLNFHPGVYKEKSEDDAIKLIAESLNTIHQKTNGFKVKSMLECTAGQGKAIGYQFEHLRKIIDLTEIKDRMSVCIDTAHIFAAGYNISEEETYNNVIKEFDDIIGIEMLKCFHINDSKKPLGSRVDRHEHIGKGFIGYNGFKLLMNDNRLSDIPKILETPKGKEQLEDLENIKVLLSLIE